MFLVVFDRGRGWRVSRRLLGGDWGQKLEQKETDWRRFSETYRMDTYGGLGFSSLENGFQAQKGTIER